MTELEVLEAEISRDRGLRDSIKAGEIKTANDQARLHDLERRIALNQAQVAILNA